MGIRFHCPNGHRLNVKAALAGRRGVCPHCGVKFPIPQASTIVSRKDKKAREKTRGSIPQPVATHELDQKAQAVRVQQQAFLGGTAAVPSQGRPSPLEVLLQDCTENTAWYVRHPHGGQYGPADSATLRHWFIEGRIPPDALLWRSDWADWKRFADLDPIPSPAPAAITGLIQERTPGTVLPIALRKRQQKTWTAIILLSVASLVMLIGLIVVVARS